MLSLLFNAVLLALILLLVSGIRAKEKAANRARTPALGNSGVASEPPRPPLCTKRMTIEGVAEVPPAQYGLVSRVGMSANRLVQLAAYAMPGTLQSFPEDVRNCLRQCYLSGEALGHETMELLYREGVLKDGQALYFALIQPLGDRAPLIKAFVGQSV